jgi:hypothetical protein
MSSPAPERDRFLCIAVEYVIALVLELEDDYSGASMMISSFVINTDIPIAEFQFS